ncbi:MAG: polyketide synthase, partial [bacterium]|nr:polyketide synthase [bacterium]
IHEFWENLKNGVDSISLLSNRELEEEGVTAELLENPRYVRARGILEDIEYFDAPFFGYTPREAELMDPQIRIFHECVWQTLEDAGYDPDSYHGPIGLFAGASGNRYWEWLSSFSGKSGDMGMWTAVQLMDKDFLTLRVSYALNLNGPSFSVYTACSTSLTAVHLACQAIIGGECDMALAGGITIMLPNKTGYIYQDGMVMSPDGRC